MILKVSSLDNWSGEGVWDMRLSLDEIESVVPKFSSRKSSGVIKRHLTCCWSGQHYLLVTSAVNTEETIGHICLTAYLQLL